MITYNKIHTYTWVLIITYTYMTMNYAIICKCEWKPLHFPPRAPEVKEHQFFKGIDWQQVYLQKVSQHCFPFDLKIIAFKTITDISLRYDEAVNSSACVHVGMHFETVYFTFFNLILSCVLLCLPLPDGWGFGRKHSKTFKETSFTFKWPSRCTLKRSLLWCQTQGPGAKSGPWWI